MKECVAFHGNSQLGALLKNSLLLDHLYAQN